MKQRHGRSGGAAPVIREQLEGGPLPKSRTQEQKKTFDHIHAEYLSGPGRRNRSTDEVTDHVLSILPDIDDPVLGFCCVTNLCYRMAEDEARKTHLGAVERLYFDCQAEWRDYGLCFRSARWATSAAATLSTFHLLTSRAERAEQVVSVMPQERLLPVWDGNNPSHMNVSIFRFNDAVLGSLRADFQRSARISAQLSSEIPSFLAELASPSGIARSNRMVDIRTMSQILQYAIQLHHVAMSGISESPYIGFGASQRKSVGINPQTLFPRFSRQWIGPSGSYGKVTELIRNGR